MGMMYRVNESIRSMDLFILVPSVPEVAGQEAGIHLGQTNKHHHGYAVRYHHVVQGCPGAFGCFKANSSAPFKHDSSFCHRLTSHFKGAKRVSSDQSDSKK